MNEFDVNTFFTESEPHSCLRRGQRSFSQFSTINKSLDMFQGVGCVFLRVTAAPRLRLKGQFVLQRCTAGGWMLRRRDAAAPSYWLPLSATLRRTDTQGHILEERPAVWQDFQLDASGMEFSFATIPEKWTLDAVIWRLDKPHLVDELQTLTPVETQGYFLLGSHSRYGRPADLYRHLIHGWVYEDRYAWPHRRRIYSENDAHALYLIFSGLHRATGKRIYSMLKTQLLLAVLSRQSEDGGYRHGEWTDNMESHYRLHCSALHLMMDALREDDDPVVRTALARGIAFISDKFDNTAVGAWFFHDELEAGESEMRRAPFKWWSSTALGKAPQNMLVLNTQLDTLIALDRYGSLTGDKQYAALVASGYEAARTVLALRPMEWLYRFLFSAIDLTLLPTKVASNLPPWKRLWKRIGWRVFIPRLPRIKTLYPRLVMPGGYIDRELSLQTWAYDYLSVNLMDLVRTARGTRRVVFMPYIRGVLDYCIRTGIGRRWLEHRGRAYAVGFYAEALFLLSLNDPSPEIDANLADALVLCIRQGLGLPPSLLGGNAEAQPAFHRVPLAARSDIVVANLSRADRPDCLIVNAGQDACRLDEALEAVPSGWSIPSGELPPGAWLRVGA